LDGCGGVRGNVNPKTQVPKNRTWGTLRASFDCKPEEATYLGHAPKKGVADRKKKSPALKKRGTRLRFTSDCGREELTNPSQPPDLNSPTI
jgi:hypothetical protein